MEGLNPQQGSLGTVLGSTTQEAAVGAAGGEGYEHFLYLVWMDLQTVILSEVRQRNTNIMLLYIHGI